MKILIVIGFVIPRAANLINLEETPYGGWVTSLIEGINNFNDVEIGVVMKSPLLKFEKIIDKDCITYYFLPNSKKDILDVKKEDARKVLDDFTPDIIHAEGAEVSITNTFFLLTKEKKVLSIKGVFNSIQKYEFGGLDIFKLIFSVNLKNIVFGASLIYQKYFRYRLRKQKEVESYKKADYILGRTLYDEAYTYAYNPTAKYRHLNESLRPKFYGKKWNITDIEKHSIFVGNGNIARKGLHVVLDAVFMLEKHFPSIKIYVVGNNNTSLVNRFLYDGYINRKIRQLGLSERVVFLGILSEEDMYFNMMNKHVNVLSSIVENSSNTLGEAMLIGLPSLVAYSGGVSSLAKDEDEVLFYRTSESTMLAYQLKRIFNNDDLAIRLNQNSIKRAEKQYSKNENSNELIKVYKEIVKNEVSI